jgi:hypothetical protein
MPGKHEITVSPYSLSRRGVVIRVNVEITSHSERSVDDILQTLWQAGVTPVRNDHGTWPPKVAPAPAANRFHDFAEATTAVSATLKAAREAGIEEADLFKLSVTARRLLNEIGSHQPRTQA